MERADHPEGQRQAARLPLNGWDNGNFCQDTNVLQTGVWITEVYYDKQPNGLGELRYTVASIFSDDGGWFGSDGNFTGHSVVVLDFNEKDNNPKGGKAALDVMGTVPPVSN